MVPSDSDYNPKVKLETGGQLLPEEPPFRILVLGDWSGKESRSVESDLSKIRPVEIDRDNFDEVLKKLKVGVGLDFQGDSENALFLEFAELEDFHPDRIFERLPLFADLRDVRRRLVNSNTFGEAAREVRSWFAETSASAKVENERENVSVKSSELPSNDLLDQILTRNDKDVAQTRNVQTSELNTFIKNIVKPHLIKIDTAEQSELLMVVDEVISDLMRKILHHPQFQSLESAWRGAHLLVRRIETDADLKIYLLDVGKPELSANLKSVNDLTASMLFETLARKNNQDRGNESWAAFFGNYTFSLDVEDVATLIRVSKIAADNESPFLSHIKPEIFGFDSFDRVNPSDPWKTSEGSTEEKLWNTLRSIPEAVYLGLALPRVLARLPYGQKTEPTESFYFEEFTDYAKHENYLWLNPAFISALLLAQTFRRNGWAMSRNFSQDVTDLPIHYYQENSENKTKPCAEITMTQNNYERILKQGLIPLISYKNIDKVRLGEFRSVAYPESSLKGRWT